MKRFCIFLLVLFLSACAHSAKTRAVQAALVAKETTDTFGDAWSTYVDYKISHCRKTLPPESTTDARLACMGLAAKSDEAQIAVDGVIAANTAIYWAVKCDGDLGDILTECVDRANPNWNSLLAELLYWLSDLRKYIRAAEGKR